MREIMLHQLNLYRNSPQSSSSLSQFPSPLRDTTVVTQTLAGNWIIVKIPPFQIKLPNLVIFTDAIVPRPDTVAKRSPISLVVHSLMAIIMEDMEVLTSILEDTMEVDQTGTNKEHVQEAITVADLITIVLATQIEIVLDDKSVVQTDLVEDLANILIGFKIELY